MGKKNKKVHVFTDFDGTITFEDIADKVFETFGKIEPYKTRFTRQEIDIFQYWAAVFGELRSGTTPEMIRELAETCQVDVNFKAFDEFCREHDIELTIVSDGFDFYMEHILRKEGLEHIPCYSNRARYENGKFSPVYPYASEGGDSLSAVNKRNMMLGGRDIDDIFVYIGDGYSDFWAAQYCDIIFAQKSLGKFLQKNKVPNYPFANFYDIKRILRGLMESGKIKTRNQAWLLRRKAFEQE